MYLSTNECITSTCLKTSINDNILVVCFDLDIQVLTLTGTSHKTIDNNKFSIACALSGSQSYGNVKVTSCVLGCSIINYHNGTEEGLYLNKDQMVYNDEDVCYSMKPILK